ncbi:MAG TPA: PEPxxWA-CTERM sorting domain-containing protein [Acidobacteriaceae bacterium]|nr:PEPxxWA-CTERM sorting domain-containing protein [Acidobacteriaceae bacterium]
MRRVLLAALATTAIGFATPASAATLVADGITYNLTLNSITNGGLTGNFTLGISGINTASDTEGGRTGINAIAFNDPATGDAVSGILSGFTFSAGSGLNSSGCSGSGNFFCFDNSSIPPTPSTLLGSSLSLVFSVTSNNAGSWTNYINPDFKIDWVGSRNNYDLVSQNIPVNRTDVPEPATWAMMLLGFGGIGMAMRRRRAKGLLQIA